MLSTSSNHPFITKTSVLTLCLGAACLLNTCGCRPVSRKSPQTDNSQASPEAEPLATSAEVQALADRLKKITEEVDQSPERRVYGVHIAAGYQADQESPLCVREVVMSVNVYWCDDGCVDGPAKTPAKDEDLLLLRPFTETLKTLDLQRTELTDAGLQTIAELTSLESLNLAGTAIRGSGLVHLSRLNKLQHLNLKETEIKPEYLQALVALSSLRTVQLPEAAITDEVPLDDQWYVSAVGPTQADPPDN